MVVRVARNAAKSGAARVVVAADDDEIVAACSAHGIDSMLTSEGARERHRSPGRGRAPACSRSAHDRCQRAGRRAAIAACRHARRRAAACTRARLRDRHRGASDRRRERVLQSRRRQSRCRRRVTCADVFTRSDSLVARRVRRRRAQCCRPDCPRGATSGCMRTAPRSWRAFRRCRDPAIEEHEKLEQLRALAQGIGIAVLQLDSALPPGVDTPDDLQRVRTMIRD